MRIAPLAENLAKKRIMSSETAWNSLPIRTTTFTCVSENDAPRRFDCSKSIAPHSNSLFACRYYIKFRIFVPSF